MAVDRRHGETSSPWCLVPWPLGSRWGPLYYYSPVICDHAMFDFFPTLVPCPGLVLVVCGFLTVCLVHVICVYGQRGARGASPSGKVRCGVGTPLGFFRLSTPCSNFWSMAPPPKDSKIFFKVAKIYQNIGATYVTATVLDIQMIPAETAS